VGIVFLESFLEFEPRMAWSHAEAVKNIALGSGTTIHNTIQYTTNTKKHKKHKNTK
jgi:hypothetical protein